MNPLDCIVIFPLNDDNLYIHIVCYNRYKNRCQGVFKNNSKNFKKSGVISIRSVDIEAFYVFFVFQIFNNPPL